MTEEQWSFLTARLSAIELLAITIARHSENSKTIRTELSNEREIMTVALLNSPQPDSQIQAVLRHIERIEKTLSG